MSLLLLFQNARVLLIKRTLGLHFIGNQLKMDVQAGGDNQLFFIGGQLKMDVQAGGDNQLFFIGTVGEVDAL